MNKHKLIHLTNEFDQCEKCKIWCWKNLETFKQSSFKDYKNYDINVRKNNEITRHKTSPGGLKELHIIYCNVSDEDYMVKEILQ